MTVVDHAAHGPATRALLAEPAKPTSLAERLNWLRAGVLGANDGVVSTAAIILGVAGASSGHAAVLVAGLIGLLAGAMSMAAGEYVSVSTQRDGERAVLFRQRQALQRQPEAELAALAEIYRAKGLDPSLAHAVAVQLTAHDALAAHAEARHGVDPSALTNPWHAAVASFVAFGAGALIPLAGVFADARLAVTVVLVVAALAVTGSLSALLGQASVTRAVLRNVAGGLAAMAITYGLGALVGVVI